MYIPELGPAVPRRGNALTRWFGRLLLRLTGWRMEGVFPNLPRCVIAVAPHTSNWDFVYGMSALIAMGIRLNWMGKHTLFKGPWGGVMRYMGGIPIDRNAKRGIVQETIAAFGARDQMMIGLAPEGTRRRAARWRTGFYYMAHGAEVPILLAYIDYKARVMGFGPIVHPTGDLEADLTTISTFYTSKAGKNEDQFQVHSFEA